MPPTTVCLESLTVLQAQVTNGPTTDARGHYTIGKELVDTVVDRVRRLVGRSAFLWRSYLVTYG